jgi:hypothetical protein
MPVEAVFPSTSRRKGMYESFYLRAVAPDEPVGVWIRYTVHKPPGAKARGALWCTVFDANRPGGPFQHKLRSEDLGVPPDGWIAIGEATLTPEEAKGTCGEASWSLRFASREPELRHLPRAWMYRAPLPRTKLTSPAPAATFEGTLEIAGSETRPTRKLKLDGWHGMVGHNWGAEHAERWIWLHGVDFTGHPDAWLDVAIGRVRVGPWTTPWVANGAVSLDGRRIPLGGPGARGLLVAETPRRCRLSLPGADGLSVDAHIDTPMESLAGWTYADPSGSHNANGLEGSRHDVANCSIAALTLTVREPGRAPARTLRTPHGAAYELGMREHDHGVPIAPFSDG